MKRFLSAILLLLLTLTGCQRKEPIQAPAAFYYPRAEIVYHDPSGVIAPEQRETVMLQKSLSKILSLYVNGPESDEYRNPFPAGTQIVELTVADNAVNIAFSDEFSQLSGIDLTIANACIGQTVFHLTDASVIKITCPGHSFDGNEVITITADMFSFSDAVEEDTAPN